MSRPAPRRHQAARLLALTSGPPPTAEEAVDVRPKPELFSSLLLTQRGRGVRYSHVYFSRFYEPGARLAFARPTTPSKPVRPHGNAAVRDQRARRSYRVDPQATQPTVDGQARLKGHVRTSRIDAAVGRRLCNALDGQKVRAGAQRYAVLFRGVPHLRKRAV